MRRKAAFSALFVILGISTFAAGPADRVREASAGWRDGAIKQDKAALEKWLADDLIYLHSSGLTQSKAEYIASVTSGPSHYQSFHESGTRISLYGNAAVLTGLEDVTPAQGDPYRVRTLEVYVQNMGRWQLAAHQSTRVPQK